MSMAFEMVPIGVVRNARTEATDDDWDRVNSTIRLDLNVVDESATVGLRSFSHVEVVFVLTESTLNGLRGPTGICAATRHGLKLASWPSEPRTGQIGSASRCAS